MTDQFQDIRPYNDQEAPLKLAQTLHDPSFVATLSAWLAPGLHKKMPWLVRPVVRLGLKAYFGRVKNVDGFQRKLAPFAKRIVKSSIAEFTVSGLDKLDKGRAYLFVSNHRDIVMDPLLVNWSLYQADMQTVRIAIGDNLLTKPFASHLMRLNKSFIVKRSVKGLKEKLRAAQQLSKYIHFSILEEQANVWIAQAEGRAKHGFDKTNSAVIGMFSLSRPKTVDYASYINELNIVPVAISYELDPTDVAKARELYAQATEGRYKKKRNEDLTSIARGLTGWKGRVHLQFGEVLAGDFSCDEDVASAIDQQIHRLYRTFETNEWAYQRLAGQQSELSSDSVERLAERCGRLSSDVQPYLLRQYANAIRMSKGEAPIS